MLSLQENWQRTEQLSIIPHAAALSATSTTTSQRSIPLLRNIYGLSAVLLWMTSNRVEREKRKGHATKALDYTCRSWKFQNQTPRRQFLKVFNLKLRSREINLKMTVPLVWIKRRKKMTVSSFCILGNIWHQLAENEGRFTCSVMREKLCFSLIARNRFVFTGKTHFLPPLLWEPNIGHYCGLFRTKTKGNALQR